MTDSLKCPFCGTELERCSYLSKGITNPVFVCRNRKCKFVDKIIGSEIWQALIDGKKAQDENKKLRVALREIVDNPHGAACHNYQRAKKALEGK